ncbi:MAG: flagellar basal body L-ring protein FlgH, partial [Stenotrophomonas chelatiphaga]
MLPAASLARLTFAAAAIALLGGCVIAGDVRPYPALAPVQPVMPPQAQATAGAIYAAGPSLQLYSDRRARDVGDLLTITLLENTQAQMSANTATSKESELAIGTP